MLIPSQLLFKPESQFVEQPSAVMSYARGPTVHGTTGTRHPSAENSSNTLVSEADAKNGEAPEGSWTSP